YRSTREPAALRQAGSRNNAGVGTRPGAAVGHARPPAMGWGNGTALPYAGRPLLAGPAARQPAGLVLLSRAADHRRAVRLAGSMLRAAGRADIGSGVLHA